jgi:hypothetical protein
MYNRESNAAQLIAICLEKCGFSRNISKVVEFWSKAFMEVNQQKT